MPTIAEIQTIPFRLPMAGTLKWGQASQMDTLEHVLVRVITDTGLIGEAEITPRPTIYGETIESVMAIIERFLAPNLIGQPLADLAALNQRMAFIANNHTAKGGIDICLHEIRAAMEQKTLLDWFETDKTKIKVSYILGIANLSEMLEEARRVYEQGVRVFKVKVGRNFEHDLSLIKQLQAEFSGQEVSLYADANQCFGMAATQQLQQLADLGILYVEEPLPVESLTARQSLRENNILPLIADDSTFTLRDLNRELVFDTFDILNIKTARTGYTQSNQMLNQARHHRKGVMVGSQASSTIGTMRAAIFAAQAGIDYPCELSFFLKLKGDIVNQPLKLTAGYLDLAQFADIHVDETQLAEYRLAA